MVIAGLCGGLDRADENRFGVVHSASHDSACALLEDGEITAALEQERVNRIKHTNKCPLPALQRCLDARGLTLADVDAFAFGVREGYLDEVVADRYTKARSVGRQCGRQYLQGLFEDVFGTRPDPARFHFVDHHLAHACSTFYPSGFDEALVFTTDGVGDSLSAAIYLATGNRLELLQTFPEEDSLGFFYLNVTRYLGFQLFDEYKVMGLAPYGDGERFASLFAELYTLRPDGTYRFHPERLPALWSRLPRRVPGAGITQSDMDIAMAAQVTLQRIALHVLQYYQQITGLEQLCLAGGVALNCSMNGELLRHGPFRRIFVQPAAHDGGLCLGAALHVHHRSQPLAPRTRLRQVYLGGDIGSAREIETLLERWQRYVEWERVDDPYSAAAELLAGGTILGWARGRSEFGPRALGNRSILADPRPAANKDVINALVKKREAFRPFAPSVLEEYAAEYFELPEDETSFPFMLFTVPVRERYRPLLGAVTHVDGSARVQTVSQRDSPCYWRLIDAFRERTGVPVVLNTSFNNYAEPIVETAADCLVCFLTTGLPMLVVDRWMIRKRQGTEDALLASTLRLAPYAKLHDTPSPQDAAASNGHARRGAWWQALRSRLVRARVPAPADAPVRVIGNTYNRREYAVSEDVFRLLLRCDGYRPIGELIDGAGVRSQSAQRACLAAIEDLWERRLVCVHP